MSYNFKSIEKKWRRYWKENDTYKVVENDNKEKYYVLDMFPYPSGSGLHVGHPLGYIASDIYSRYKRLKGFNVLHPMGYDSFGLPTEQYAIETGIHPSIATKNNTNRYREQLENIGFSYDWSREIQTSDPCFYNWTQWIFKELFNSYYCKETKKAKDIKILKEIFSVRGNLDIKENSRDQNIKFSAREWNSFDSTKKEDILQCYRLAYLSETLVNWCPELGTVLANDEVKSGLSERGGYPVVQKHMKQWSLRITSYADRLLSDLDNLDWPDSIKEIQKNWIGKSKGCSILFNLEEKKEKIEVYTTRPDTIFGVNFIVLSPEHKLIKNITVKENEKSVIEYINYTNSKSERDRQSDNKVTGVFTGSYAIHPFTKERVAIWISEYVLSSYGSGAIMAVPCGDQRDWDFAKHFDIEIINIFENIDVTKKANTNKDVNIINSNFLNGLSVKEAILKSIEKIENDGLGIRKTNFRLRDATFSRQRYWGEPFPVYYEDGIPKLFNDGEHVTLPKIDKFSPTLDGEPPLARANKEDWNIFRGEKMEVNVMPGWAGSSWYFLRYMDPNNNLEFCSKKKSDYWGQVDLYIGGAEHAVGHLLYSRFWTKFLYDKGFISFKEPFKKLINQGMILGRSSFVYKIFNENTFVSYDMRNQYKTTRMNVDISMVENDILDIEKFKKWRHDFKDSKFILNGNNKYICGVEIEKMSKSKYNVQTPDELVENYGADTLRLYEMFLGSLEQSKPWDIKGINGVHNFLKKFWRLTHDEHNNFIVNNEDSNNDNYKTLHKTIKKVGEDIERYSFNTAVSTLMICVNELTEQKCRNRDIISLLTILISPYAPHIAEEVWFKLGNKESINNSKFPEFDPSYLIEKEITYPISFNGKTRFKLELPLSMDKKELEDYIMNHEKTKHYLDGKKPKKIIVVPKRIINIVV